MSDSFTTPWTEARQAPLTMGFPRQEHWGGLMSPFPGDLPNQGSNSHLLHLLSHQGSPNYTLGWIQKWNGKESWESRAGRRSGVSGGLTVRVILKEGGAMPCVMNRGVFQAERVVSTEPWRWEHAWLFKERLEVRKMMRVRKIKHGL